MSIDAAERAALAERAAEAGATVAMETFRSGLPIETKSGRTDFVTRADLDAQAKVVEVINEVVPDEPVVGEEDGIPSTVPDEGPAWVVDPVDGSNNYVRGLPLWTTSVAAVVDTDPVAAATVLPTLGDTYVAGPEGATRNGEPIAVSEVADPRLATVVPTIWWPMDRRNEYAAAVSGIVERFGDMRRWGAVQAVMAHLADGGLEGALTNVVVNPWDAYAGVVLVRQAGGTVTDLEGTRWENGARGMVASNGAVHEDVLEVAREIDDAAR